MEERHCLARAFVLFIRKKINLNGKEIQLVCNILENYPSSCVLLKVANSQASQLLIAQTVLLKPFGVCMAKYFVLSTDYKILYY